MNLYVFIQEFVSEAKCLLGDEHLCKTITAKAQDYVNKHHSGETEKQTYCRLISKYVFNDH